MQPLWWLGFLGLLVGSLADWVALAFAASSLITPVGATTIVANLWMSQWVLGETLTRRDVAGTLLIISGVVLVAVFSSRKESCVNVDTLLQLYLQVPFLIFAGAMALATFGVHRLANYIEATLSRFGPFSPQYRR